MSDRSTVLTHLNNARATLTLYVGKLNEAKTLYELIETFEKSDR